MGKSTVDEGRVRVGDAQHARQWDAHPCQGFNQGTKRVVGAPARDQNHLTGHLIHHTGKASCEVREDVLHGRQGSKRLLLGDTVVGHVVQDGPLAGA